MNYNKIKHEYLQGVATEHRKKYAQFFTPELIAALMVDWLQQNKKMETVLDPACGLGIFPDILLSRDKNLKIDAYEIDEVIYEKSKNFLKGNIQLLLENFILSKDDKKYDGIICNPPYLKFHNYDNQNFINRIEEQYGIKISKFTNLYALFLIKSLYKMNEDANLAFIIPSEFMNSDYGVIIKKILLESKTLRHVINIDLKENIFEDAITTSCIILCSNNKNYNYIRFHNILSLKDLKNLFENIKNSECNSGKKISFFDIDCQLKWRNYYHSNQKYRNIIPFSSVAKVTRGIATGANNFFTFSEEKAIQNKIPINCLITCVCKSSDVNTSFFTKKDIVELIKKNKNIYLLNAENSNDINVLNYIKIGENLGINKKHLTSKRNPWYALEKRKPAPILVSVFNRSNIKFVRNETESLNLTNFHCVYPKKDFLDNNISIDLFFAYLITDIAKDLFNQNKREYGNGLNKFEPNDLNNSYILDLFKLDKDTSNRILNLYYEYRLSELRKIPQLELIDQINQIFKDFYGISDSKNNTVF